MTRARNGFATLIGVALTTMLAIPTAASALGPGGWGNLGDSGPTMPTFSALDGRADVLNTDMAGKLIAGGAFTAAGVPAATTTDDDHIAIWDGRSWSPLGAGAGLNGDARALAFKDGKIYAGGVFTNAGGNTTADSFAVWDTTAVTPSWQPFCGQTPNTGNVDALEIIGNTLYIGGAFQNWAGIAPADYLVACDLTSGTPTAMVVADNNATGGIRALATDSNGDLYAGGNFINWGTILAADYVVKYVLPGTTPSSLGANAAINTTGVDSLTTIGTDVYVGTDDVDVDGIANADHIVKWSGSAWSAAGANTAGTNGYFAAVDQGPADVQSLTTSGSTVFASGNWSNANGEPLSDGVARFDASCAPVPGVETCWDNVGSNGALNNGPLSGNLHYGLAVFNNSLVVGGNFSNAGGDDLADSIACFPLGATPCILPASDTTAPQTTITSGPGEGSTISDTSPSFGFSSTEAGSTFECKVDTGAFAACNSPKQIGPLADGSHTFSVRAIDAANNVDASSASRTFTVNTTPPPDTTPPDTSITKARISQAKRKAKFTFISSESKPTFRCRLDKKPFKDCVAPKTYKNIKPGRHTFEVRATDRAGNTDPTPAKRKFKI